MTGKLVWYGRLGDMPPAWHSTPVGAGDLGERFDPMAIVVAVMERRFPNTQISVFDARLEFLLR